MRAAGGEPALPEPLAVRGEGGEGMSEQLRQEFSQEDRELLHRLLFRPLHPAAGLQELAVQVRLGRRSASLPGVAGCEGAPLACGRARPAPRVLQLDRPTPTWRRSVPSSPASRTASTWSCSATTRRTAARARATAGSSTTTRRLTLARAPSATSSSRARRSCSTSSTCKKENNNSIKLRYRRSDLGRAVLQPLAARRAGGERVSSQEPLTPEEAAAAGQAPLQPALLPAGLRGLHLGTGTQRRHARSLPFSDVLQLGRAQGRDADVRRHVADLPRVGPVEADRVGVDVPGPCEAMVFFAGSSYNWAGDYGMLGLSINNGAVDGSQIIWFRGAYRRVFGGRAQYVHAARTSRTPSSSCAEARLGRRRLPGSVQSRSSASS